MPITGPVVHTITTELTIGSLVFATIALVLKYISDRQLRKNPEVKEGMMVTLSRFGDPASYYAAVVGTLFLGATIVSGLLTWPFEALISTQLVHNKITTVIFALTFWVMFVVMRRKYDGKIWEIPGLRKIYTIVGVIGFYFIVAVGSLGGHLAGKGSILDAFYHAAGLNTHTTFYLPQVASIAVILAVVIATAATISRAKKVAKGV